MKQQRGYSLIEIIVVVGIIGIFSLAAIPSFVKISRANQVKAANRQVVSDIRNLRQICASRSIRGKLTFNTGSTERRYQLQLLQNNVWTDFGTPKELQETIYFTGTTFTNLTGDADTRPDLVVNANGTMTAGTVSIRTDMKIPNNQYSISVNTAGQVSSTGITN
jgi:prepilin-type N-terminal cleavage/methylation domain-containing protein